MAFGFDLDREDELADEGGAFGGAGLGEAAGEAGEELLQVGSASLAVGEPLRPDVEAGNVLVESFEFGAELGDFAVDVVGGDALGLAGGGFRVEVEPALSFVGERGAAAAEAVRLLFLPGRRGLLFVGLAVEVFEHDLGSGEVAADVVPDEWFELVCADAGVVAGEAALVGAAVACAGVAADGAVLDGVVALAAVGVAAGLAADLAFERVLVALAAAVLGPLFLEAPLRLFVALAADDRGDLPGDERAWPAGALAVDPLAAVEGAGEDALDGEALPAAARLACPLAPLARAGRSALLLVGRWDAEFVQAALDGVEAEPVVDQPGVHLADDGRLRLVDLVVAGLIDAVAEGDDSAGVAAFAGGAVDAFLGALDEAAHLGGAEDALDAEHDEVVEVVGPVGAFRGGDGDAVFLAGADDPAEVLEAGVAGEAALFDHEHDVELITVDHLEQAAHAGPAADRLAADAEVFDDGVRPASLLREFR